MEIFKRLRYIALLKKTGLNNRKKNVCCKEEKTEMNDRHEFRKYGNPPIIAFPWKTFFIAIVQERYWQRFVFPEIPPFNPSGLQAAASGATGIFQPASVENATFFH